MTKRKLNAKIPRALYLKLRKEWGRNDKDHGISFNAYIVKLLKREAAKHR
jgi:hypothetical protein